MNTTRALSLVVGRICHSLVVPVELFSANAFLHKICTISRRVIVPIARRSAVDGNRVRLDNAEEDAH